MARGRKFAVFDIDGTLIRWQLYHAIADALVRLGFVASYTYDPVKSARMKWKRREPGASFKTYETELIKVYEEVLKTLTTDQFETAAKAVFDEYKDQVYTYTRDLIAKLKDERYLLLAISGSQSEIIERIAKHYGFDGYLATEYETRNGRYTGNRVFHAQYKDRALNSLIKRFGAVKDSSIGVGDSFSDAVMLGLIEQPIAFNPERGLFEHAKKRGWKLVIERKNMVYELERRDGKYELVKTNA